MDEGDGISGRVTPSDQGRASPIPGKEATSKAGAKKGGKDSKGKKEKEVRIGVVTSNIHSFVVLRMVGW